MNASLLAPGTHYGRLTLFTEGAIEALAQNKLFTRHSVKQVQVHKKNEIPQKVKIQTEPAVAGSKMAKKENKAAKKTPTKKEASKK